MCMRAVNLLRTPAPWLCVIAIALLALLAEGAPSATIPSDPPRTNLVAAPSQKPERPPARDLRTSLLLSAPKPAPARREDFPPVFSKPVPTSVADLRTIQQHVEKLVTRVTPAVVAVEVGHASGSGVIISSNGLVLTAGHVCGGAGRDARVTFANGRKANARTLGADLEADTGLMQITDPGPWPCAPVGDLRQARAGDWVVAMGHPGGFDLRRSLVVRLGRVIELAPELLQSDCPISPGDSGGPLFDMHGRVIGIHSLISSSASENFHVPITEYYDGWEMLVKGAGSPTRIHEDEEH
jgi:serine protease Do